MPASARTAATDSGGIAPARTIVGCAPEQSTMVDASPPLAGPPSSTRSIRVAELRDDARRVGRLRDAGAVRRRRGQRPHAAGERSRGVVVGHAQADRGAPAGQHGRPRNVGALRDDQGQATGPERGRQDGCPRRDAPGPGRLRHVVEQQHHRLVRRTFLDAIEPLDPARRGQGHGDAIDRVGRKGDDAAFPQDPHSDGPTLRIVRDDPRRHADRLRRSSASAASRCDAARTSAGFARTSCSMICAAPSSSSGGAT